MLRLENIAENSRKIEIGKEKQKVICSSVLFLAPDVVIEFAKLQKFARINPHYPGVRAPLPRAAVRDWITQIGPMLGEAFAPGVTDWDGEVWFSMVIDPPESSAPIQRLPHVDGTSPQIVAMMAYLGRTPHGGTSFYRHKATGYETLTEQRYPHYAEALQREVREHGMPPPEYPTDGGPLFERIHASEGAFNSAIFYRGNLLHSGAINNDHPLDARPDRGRLTINGFFRPRTGVDTDE